MKITVSKSYTAADGKVFATREECAAYEDEAVFKPLLNLKEVQLKAILTGEDKTRGALIEKLRGKLLKQKRASGEMKPRKRKAKDAEPAGAETPKGAAEAPQSSSKFSQNS